MDGGCQVGVLERIGKGLSPGMAHMPGETRTGTELRFSQVNSVLCGPSLQW